MLNFKDLPKCNSYKLVMVLSTISLIMTLTRPNSPRKMNLLAYQLVWFVLYHFLFAWLCKKGYTTVSWALILVPFYFMSVLNSFAMGVVVGAEAPEEDRQEIKKVLTPSENQQFKEIWQRNRAVR